MFRTFTVVVVACLTFGLAGCRFCASPYDYCSPTFTGNNHEFYRGNPCHPNYTAGSRFLGTEEVCRCGQCSTCGSYSESGCSCGTGHEDFVPDAEEESVPVTRAITPSVKSVKKMPAPPSPPASPTIAVPQAIQETSSLKKSVQTQSAPRELSAPKPAVPQTNYAKQAVQSLNDSDFSDPDTMLSELKELNPDAVEVKIIGFE
ncbi:MAG: hypothetical protein FWC43_03170 [Planctomycetaceae bacterium]|nr:hypothetical protein [Planctomycetaceae bacterium]